MTVVHSALALHTTHRSTQECLEAYARTEENPVLLGQALDEYTNIYLQQLELQEMTSPTDEVEYADENDPEEGASTAEYGIVMLAAVGFAGLLVAILKSDEIRGMLVDMVKNALATGGSGLTFGLF